MPPNTGVPTARRLSAPAPVAMTKGSRPNMKAKLVIMTGRKRSLAPSTAASRMGLPSRRLNEMRLSERPNRNHRAAFAADINTIDVVDLVAKPRFGLDIDLPGAAEQVKVVYVKAAERRLQRTEDVADLDAQHLRLVAVDLKPDLRRVGGVGAEDASKLGLLVGGDEEAAHDGC